MLTDLKPCPFCGGEAKIKRGKTVMVSCSKCTASTFQSLCDTDSAIAAWNRRAIEAEVLQAQEPVAWMSPGKERIEFSRPDTVYGSHTIPLYPSPQPPAPCPKCAELTEKYGDVSSYIEVFEGRYSDKSAECGALQAKVAYYEAQMCLPDNPLIAIPSGYTAQVAARSVSPERVADVLTQREELRAEVERLTQTNADLREKLHDESAQHVQFMLHDHPKALAARDATIAQQAERIAELEQQCSDLEGERDDAENQPWPEWSETILKIIRKRSGYDGFDDADGVDLPEELRELLSGNDAEFDREHDRLVAANERIATQAALIEKCEKALESRDLGEGSREDLEASACVNTIRALKDGEE